jgi:FtsZ-binding cell division protein ZapB
MHSISFEFNVKFNFGRFAKRFEMFILSVYFELYKRTNTIRLNPYPFYIFILFFVLYLVLHYLMSVSVPKMDKFEQILDRKLTPLLAKFDQLKDKVDDALSSLSFLSEKYEEIKGKVSQLEESNKGLKKENLFLNKELSKATNDIKNLRELQDEFEQYGRRECLEIRGIPQLQCENTNDIIVKISSKVGVVIKKRRYIFQSVTVCLFKDVMLIISTLLL